MMKNLLFGLIVVAMVGMPALGQKPPKDQKRRHGGLGGIVNPAIRGARNAEAAAEISDIDLTGEYNMAWKDKESGEPTSLNVALKKSPIHYQYGTLSAQLYTFDKKISPLKGLVGVFMIKDKKTPGKNRMVWVMLKENGSIKTEGNILIKKEGKALIFGGDGDGDKESDKKEAFRLTKLDKTVLGFGK